MNLLILGQAALQTPKFFEILRWMRVLDSFDFIRVKMDPVWRDNESQELATRNPPRRILSDSFLVDELALYRTLFSSHEDNYSYRDFWQQCCRHNILPSFGGGREKLYSLHVDSCSRILQPEGHHSIAVYPQWCPERCILFIIRVHLDLIVSREWRTSVQIHRCYRSWHM